MDSNYYFNLREAAIYQALRWQKLFKFCRVFQKLFFILFVIVFVLFLYGFLGENFSQETNLAFLGGNILFLTFGIICRLGVSFFEVKLKNPAIKNKENLAEFLSFEAARAVHKGRLDDAKLEPVFYRLLLDPREIKKIKIDFRPEIILEIKEMAAKRGCQKIEIGDLLVVLAKTHPVFKEILIQKDLRVEDFENLVWWLESLERRIKERKRWWEYRNLLRRGALAKEWTAGYTVTLDQFSTDWTEVIKKRGSEEIIGHKEALEHLERVLARTEINNALLVGEPGTGRKSIINALVQRSLFGQSLPEINYKRIVELDIVSILATAQSTEEATNILDTIFREALSAGNVILVIDEFYNFVTQSKGALGVIDISGVLSRYLSLVDFRLIGITSYYGLHLFVEKSVAILPYMEKVEAKEISERETILILQNLATFLERKYKKFIPYPTIRGIVRYSNRYIKDVPFPKKAIDLLDEVLVYASRYGKTPLVLPEYVVKVISEKADIPLGEVEIKERDVLLNLEALLHQRIINQEEAVKEVSSALRRARSEITARSGPMGTFLFLGPTGVGKTETSKALAAIYFGAESRMIRLDMSEFQDTKDISRLLGSSEEEGLLASPVRENPFSLVLLDEIEKAHTNILNLFLQVLDEGHLTDGLGRKVDFKNTVIIATSNAGYEMILQALKEKGDWSAIKQKLLDYIFEKGIFRPEFVNRFDATVVFKPLSRENLLAIAELLLQRIKKNLKEKGIDFAITLPLKEKIVELGYDPTFGARQMRRVLQDKVENILATALLSGAIQRGDKIEINPEDFQIIKK
jgi:ATP-dependent Clp protease ATP-binding subunit ClpC